MHAHYLRLQNYSSRGGADTLAVCTRSPIMLALIFWIYASCHPYGVRCVHAGDKQCYCCRLFEAHPGGKPSGAPPHRYPRKPLFRLMPYMHLYASMQELRQRPKILIAEMDLRVWACGVMGRLCIWFYIKKNTWSCHVPVGSHVARWMLEL